MGNVERVIHRVLSISSFGRRSDAEQQMVRCRLTGGTIRALKDGRMDGWKPVFLRGEVEKKMPKLKFGYYRWYWCQCVRIGEYVCMNVWHRWVTLCHTTVWIVNYYCSNGSSLFLTWRIAILALFNLIKVHFLKLNCQVLNLEPLCFCVSHRMHTFGWFLC